MMPGFPTGRLNSSMIRFLKNGFLVCLISFLVIPVSGTRKKSPFGYCGGWLGQHSGSNRIGKGTAELIAPSWAITAAHCVNETALGTTIKNGRRFAVEVGNQTREIDVVLMHPEIVNSANPEVDLALLRFRQASPIPRPIPPYDQTDEKGEVVTLIGWGYFGLGTTGRQFDDGTKRRAQNRISEANLRLQFIFDDPREVDSDSLPLEGMLGLGDSGGPALISVGNEFRLAGVAIGELGGESFSEETQGEYGSVAVYERISFHVDWIESVIESER